MSDDQTLIADGTEKGPWVLRHWDPYADDRRGDWHDYGYFRSYERAVEAARKENDWLDARELQPALDKYETAIKRYDLVLLSTYERQLFEYNVFMRNTPPKPPVEPERPQLPTEPRELRARGDARSLFWTEHYFVSTIQFEDDES